MERQEEYTGATERLYMPADYAAPITQARRPVDWTPIAVAVAALLMILAISRAPQPAPVAPAQVDNHVEVFSRNCIGYCP